MSARIYIDDKGQQKRQSFRVSIEPDEYKSEPPGLFWFWVMIAWTIILAANLG